MPATKRGASTRELRVDRHHFHRRELLASLHQPDLGGQRGPGAAGEQQRRDDRTELAHQGQCHQQAERLGRAVARQRVVALQRQHEADRQARRRDDDQRVVADRVDLGRSQVEAAQVADGTFFSRFDEEERAVAQPAQHFERRRPAQRRAVTNSASPSMRAAAPSRSSAIGRAPGSGTAPDRRARRG